MWVDAEDLLTRPLIPHVLPDAVGDGGVAALRLVVRIPRPHHARREVWIGREGMRGETEKGAGKIRLMKGENNGGRRKGVE